MQQDTTTDGETQGFLNLGITTNPSNQETLDVLATYRFRVRRNGIQMLTGRYGTETWLVTLGRLALWQGREKALDEIQMIVTLLGEHSDPEYCQDGAFEGECEWLELHGRQAIRAALGESVAGGAV